MRPKAIFQTDFSQILAAWVIGIIIGAALTSLSVGYHLDKINNHNQVLEGQLLEKEAQLKILEEKVSSAKKWSVVEEIIIELELPDKNFPDQESLHHKIEQEIREMIKDIRGKKLQDLDPQILWSVIDKRNVNITGHNFTLEMRSIIISEKLTYYVFAEFKEPRQPLEDM